MSWSGSYIISSYSPIMLSPCLDVRQGSYKTSNVFFLLHTQNTVCSSRISILYQEFVHFIFDVKYFVYPLVVRLVLLDVLLLLVFSSSKVLSLLTSLKILVLIFSFGLFCTLLLVMFFFCYFLNLHTWCIFLTFFFQHLRLYAYYSGLPFPKLISFICSIFKFHFFLLFIMIPSWDQEGFFN